LTKKLKLIFQVSYYVLFFLKQRILNKKNLIMINIKKNLLKKKLLLNSFKKCEEYINETSVELFLNFSHENDKEK